MGGGVGKVTCYAPLDPEAVEGMCYSGDPKVTASGHRTTLGESVAAAPSIPFYTPVWVQGFGAKIVHDRGGAITDGRWDVAVEDKSQAYGFGVREKIVIYRAFKKEGSQEGEIIK